MPEGGRPGTDSCCHILFRALRLFSLDGLDCELGVDQGGRAKYMNTLLLVWPYLIDVKDKFGSVSAAPVSRLYISD